MNLLTNAGEEPGNIVITTGERWIDEVEARGLSMDTELAPGRYVNLEVRDSGSGIAPATLERIFDPFFSTKFTGRGLGLAAVLGIVRRHRGGIFVDSTLGKGSTFKVLLPSSRVGVEQAPPPAAGYAGPGLVLVIDDDANVREAVRKMLSANGLFVLEAPDGRAGVHACIEHTAEITLVLLDMSMPGMDGEETFRAIRERSRVPVVLMSGYGEMEATRRFSSSGLAGFLQKPFSSEHLSEQLRRVFQDKA